MQHLIVLLLTAVIAKAADDGLKTILASPTQTLQLYNKFKGNQHLTFSGSEDSKRFRIFKLSAHFVTDQNAVEGETATFGLNFFSTMTEAEKKNHLGLNATGHETPRVSSTNNEKRLSSVPSKKLWLDKVTEVKDQGSCGSCWTFGAVGGLETRYAKISGVLRSFAEQEYLDCVYSAKNGCNGGWPDHCYDYSKIHSGRLAAASNYNYKGYDGMCDSSWKTDAMVSAKITGYTSVGAGEANNIAALAEGSLSMALEVTDRFMQYQSGILRDTSCWGTINHAVTGVGYTPTYVLVKNSWGTVWGDSGFVKLARNHGNCQLFDYSSYPELTATADSDSGSDSATSYTAGEDGEEEETEEPCTNEISETSCRYYDNKYNYCSEDWFVRDHCQAYCGGCGQCPSGTTLCDDGVCRHVHMC